MAGVRLTVGAFAAPLIVPPAHQGRIPSKGLRRGKLHGIVLGPQTCLRITEGRDTTQMGNVNRCQQNLEVVRVDTDRNLLLVKGGVPGPVGGRFSADTPAPVKTTTASVSRRKPRIISSCVFRTSSGIGHISLD